MSRELIGQRFGRLTVSEATTLREDHYILWRCRCDCGNEILVNTRRLKRNTITSCGCIKKTGHGGAVAEDLTGQTFHALTVLRRTENINRHVAWECRCVCGNKHKATSAHLKSGRVKSCGCLNRKPGGRMLDLRGQRFGRLVAVEPTEKRDAKKSVYWLCRCDCGNEREYTADRLMYGSYQSCGCLKQENQKQIFQRLHLVDGTCVEWLEKRKHRSDNNSGFRGVSQMKNGSYQVSIGFKRKRFYLGVYRDFNAAVEARMKAEELLHNRFVDSYYSWKDKADKDPDWAKQHPFVFEVEQVDQTFRITTTL